jgi:hypothetical protein
LEVQKPLIELDLSKFKLRISKPSDMMVSVPVITPVPVKMHCGNEVKRYDDNAEIAQKLGWTVGQYERNLAVFKKHKEIVNDIIPDVVDQKTHVGLEMRSFCDRSEVDENLPVYNVSLVNDVSIPSELCTSIRSEEELEIKVHKRSPDVEALKISDDEKKKILVIGSPPHLDECFLELKALIHIYRPQLYLQLSSNVCIVSEIVEKYDVIHTSCYYDGGDNEMQFIHDGMKEETWHQYLVSEMPMFSPLTHFNYLETDLFTLFNNSGNVISQYKNSTPQCYGYRNGTHVRFLDADYFDVPLPSPLFGSFRLVRSGGDGWPCSFSMANAIPCGVESFGESDYLLFRKKVEARLNNVVSGVPVEEICAKRERQVIFNPMVPGLAYVGQKFLYIRGLDKDLYMLIPDKLEEFRGKLLVIDIKTERHDEERKSRVWFEECWYTGSFDKAYFYVYDAEIPGVFFERRHVLLEKKITGMFGSTEQFLDSHLWEEVEYDIYYLFGFYSTFWDTWLYPGNIFGLLPKTLSSKENVMYYAGDTYMKRLYDLSKEYSRTLDQKCGLRSPYMFDKMADESITRTRNLTLDCQVPASSFPRSFPYYGFLFEIMGEIKFRARTNCFNFKLPWALFLLRKCIDERMIGVGIGCDYTDMDYVRESPSVMSNYLLQSRNIDVVEHYLTDYRYIEDRKMRPSNLLEGKVLMVAVCRNGKDKEETDVPQVKRQKLDNG